MPRPRHAQGRRGTQVIPADWAATHAPVIARTLPHTCTIAHPDRAPGSEFDRTTGSYVGADFDTQTGTYPDPAPVPHFTGPCRVEALAGQAEPVAGDEVIPTVTYHLVLALDDAPEAQVDDIVTTSLGTTLRVRALLQGSYAFERTLACTENQS